MFHFENVKCGNVLIRRNRLPAVRQVCRK